MKDFLSFIEGNLATVITLAVIAAIVALIIVGIVRDRKAGKSSCGCSCASCPMGGACHGKSKENN